MNHEQMHFLLQARIAEEKDALRAEGYEITDVKNGVPADFIAKKGNQTLLFEVKASADLKTDSKKIVEAQKYASAHGFTDYRLIVVPPPRKIEIEFPDLANLLYDYIVNIDPYDFSELPGNTMVEEVADVEISKLTIDEGEIKIVGTATVVVNMAIDGGEERDGVDWGDSYSMDFSVTLSLDPLRITGADHILVETDTFFEGNDIEIP